MKLRFLLVFCVFVFAFCNRIEQQRATLKYANPKFLKDVKILTARTRKNEPYMTNGTWTAMVPMGNNVTLQLAYKIMDVDFTWKILSCDIYQQRWLVDYFKTVSDMFDEEVCPFPARTYKMINMEFPLKKSPLPMPNGDTLLVMKLFVTATKELILEVQIQILVR